MSRLFGTDGIRGIANEELTCELAMSVGRAVASVLEDCDGATLRVIVGYDTRISSKMLSASISAGLCSMGCSVCVVGVAPTPAIAYLVRTEGFDAGIMLTASHNPSEFNGIKIFSSNGFKLPDELEDKIESIVLDKNNLIKSDRRTVGSITNSDELLEKYIEYLKNISSFNFGRMNIALDCSNGSACATAKKLFSQLFCSVHLLFDMPNGYNINEKCGSTHIDSLKSYVVENKCDVGFAFDGDADRCLCIDENGEVVDGDDILALCALDMKNRGKLKNNTLVGTVMSNFGLYKFCQSNKIAFTQTKVGDRYVLEEMLLNEYYLGGEQSGHIIFGDCATTGDGQLTALKVLSVMNRSGEPLSKLKSVLNHYPQVLINVKVSSEGKLRFYTDSQISKAIKQAENELADSGRILVRPSGTEPLIRVMVEGNDEVQINKIASTVATIIKSNLV